jgi:pilus assembly protein CpaE
MDARTAIAVIDLDGDSNLLILDMLKEVPDISVMAESQDLYRGISLVRRVNPAIVILNLYPSEETAMEYAQKIHQFFPDCALIMTAKKMNSNLVLNAMRAGAREFVQQPVNKDELVDAVKRILQARREAAPDSLMSSKMVTVFGTRGGTGATTVAANLAALLARHAGPHSVVIDLNFQFGDAGLVLNVKNRCSILDLVCQLDRLDVSQLPSLLPRTPDGVSLLTGPARIEEAESITCGHLEQILLAVRRAFPYIVIDAPRVLNDFTVKAMDESDHVLVVATPDVPSIYNMTRCLELFQKMGYSREKLLLALNRCNGTDELDAPAIEDLLKYPVSWRLPKHDPAAMADAVNRGVLVSKLLPNAKLSQGLLKMAEHMAGGAAAAAERSRPATPPMPGFLQRMLK